MEVRQPMALGRTKGARRSRIRGDKQDDQSAEQAPRESDEQGSDEQSDEQESDMAEQQQETTGNQGQGVDLSQQITEAIQPVMEDLQQQITQTVQQQLGGEASVGSNGASALSLDNLGSVGETLQSSMETVVESLQPFFQWIMEKIQQLVSWIMGMFMGGSEGESDEASESGEAEAESSE